MPDLDEKWSTEEGAPEAPVRYSTQQPPLPPGSDAALLQYFALQRARTIRLLGHIDTRLDQERERLDRHQPRWSGRLGLVWRPMSGRYLGAVQPDVVIWLMRHFSGQSRWFYTVLPLNGLSRRAKRSGGWAEGAPVVQESLREIADLMRKRERILGQWSDLSRSLTNHELLLGIPDGQKASGKPTVADGPEKAF